MRRVVLGLWESVNFTFRERKPRVVTPHGDLWLHRHVGATLIAETSTAMNPVELDAKNINYFFHDYRPRPGDTIIDIGAGDGTELLTSCRLVGPTGRVIAVEAHPATFARLAETKRRNPRVCANAELLCVAVADRAGRVVITDRTAHGANSIVISNEPGLTVEAVTVDEIVERCGLERIDHLKMNIEGAERLAIRGLDRSLPLVRHLTVCCHDFLADDEGEVMRTRDEVRDWMRSGGFAVCERPDERLLFIRDTLYGRRSDDGQRDEASDPYRTFLGLSSGFHAAYFDWHGAGQYEGVDEFASIDDVVEHPPPRERDDWYRVELDAVDRYWVPLAGARVLEIGCGDGNLTAKLARRSAEVTSCDIDDRAVALTSQRLIELGLTEAVRVEVRDAVFGDVSAEGAYDVVFFVQVLEHVPGWEQAALFDRVLDLVAPGGCLFVSTPNRWAVRDAHDSGKLFIHWLPRRIRVPIARRLGWGIAGQDPSWPYPPVLHDYVSFAWMRRRARRRWSGGRASAMTFYPTVEAWETVRRSKQGPSGRLVRLVWRGFGAVERWLPPNLYLGEKVVFLRPLGGAQPTPAARRMRRSSLGR